MAEYNGHRSRTAWNVALWIANDEPLYRFAMNLLKASGYRPAAAARRMLAMLPKRTPDGYRYTYKSVWEALQGLNEK